MKFISEARQKELGLAPYLSTDHADSVEFSVQGDVSVFEEANANHQL